MVNFSLHVSGPRIRTLLALANGETAQRSGVVVSGLARDGLVQIMTVPSEAEGITIDQPFLTERGRTVLGLIEQDIADYLIRVKVKKPKQH